MLKHGLVALSEGAHDLLDPVELVEVAVAGEEGLAIGKLALRKEAKGERREDLSERRGFEGEESSGRKEGRGFEWEG